MMRTQLLSRAAIAAFAAVAASGVGFAQTAKAAPVEAFLYSTMPSTSAHRPEMALDGDPATYFRSAYGMEDGDDFIVLLSRPIPVASIRVSTGDPDNDFLLTDGFLEVSPDGTTYAKAADFDKSGVANADLRNRPVMAIRLRLNRGKGLSRLTIREIEIHSSVPVSHVRIGPARGFIDLSQAPDLADWAARAEKEMEEFWPDTAAILYSDGFITPNAVNVVYKTGPGVTDVAATGGGVMTVNSKWCREHPEDTGLTVHEMAHVVQSIGSSAPGWLIEGTADYIRWVKFEPQNFHPRINVAKSTYHDAYRTSATFLAWVALHYDSEIVTKLNRTVRDGGYSNDLFVKYTGKDVDTLWKEFLAAYQADPEHVITPPTPAGMIPRALPAVQAGTSVPVDLSSAFDVTGIAADGAKFGTEGGFDAGGAAYSATLLGSAPTARDVRFRLGPAGAPDAVSAKGQTISLPAGAHKSLWLLAAAINGDQRDQPVVVTYTDGSTATFAQNFSDWYLPEIFPGETRAVATSYRNMADGSRDPRNFFVYGYGYPLDPNKTVRSVTLPNDDNIRVLAVSLAD